MKYYNDVSFITDAEFPEGTTEVQKITSILTFYFNYMPEFRKQAIEDNLSNSFDSSHGFLKSVLNALEQVNVEEFLEETKNCLDLKKLRELNIFHIVFNDSRTSACGVVLTKDHAALLYSDYIDGCVHYQLHRKPCSKCKNILETKSNGPYR